jgi:hypothetical protein
MLRKRGTRERRRAERKPVQWVGRYATAPTGDTPWFPCAVVNVSGDGAGLVLFGGLSVDVGETLVMDIERIGPTPVMLTLRGTARYVGARTVDGGVDIGVQLAFDHPQERQTARFLFAN